MAVGVLEGPGPEDDVSESSGVEGAECLVETEHASRFGCQGFECGVCRPSVLDGESDVLNQFGSILEST